MIIEILNTTNDCRPSRQGEYGKITVRISNETGIERGQESTQEI